MLFRRVRRKVNATAGVGRRPVESLEGRQYWYTPDMYVPLTGAAGGCGCGCCGQCLGTTPQQNVELDDGKVEAEVARLMAAAAADAVAAAAEAAPAVTGLELYDVDTNQSLGAFGNGAALDFASLPANVSLRAATAGDVGSVRFGLDADANVHTENFAPFFLLGEDAGGKPVAWRPGDGTHTLRVTAFGGRDGTGAAGTPVDVAFTVANAPTAGSAAPDGDGGAVVQFSKSLADADEFTGDPGTIVVSRVGSADLGQPLQVSYTANGRGAFNGSDYDVLPGTITIPAGQSSVDLVVRPVDDFMVEGTEFVDVQIAPGAGGAYAVGASSAGRVMIVDNDVPINSGPGPNPPPFVASPTPTTPTPTPTGAVADITWSRGGPRAPQPKTEAGGLQIGSKVYSIGGFTAEGGSGEFFPLTRRLHVYDMATRQWTELARIPSAAAGNHFGVATDGANIYTVAGQVTDTYGIGTNTVYKYNIASDTWSKFPENLPAVRFGGVAFVEGGWLHFVGGDKSDRETPVTDHWAIDLSDTSTGWVRKASMPLPGDHLSHTTINGKVYLFGGEHGHHGLGEDDENGYVQHDYTFEYDPGTDTWARKADMPIALSHIEGSTLNINGKAVLIGGLLDGGGDNTTNRVHVYDPVADAWRTLDTRYPKRIIGAVSGYWAGKIYMTEGFSPDEDDRQVGYEGTVEFA